MGSSILDPQSSHASLKNKKEQKAQQPTTLRIQQIEPIILSAISISHGEKLLVTMTMFIRLQRCCIRVRVCVVVCMLLFHSQLTNAWTTTPPLRTTHPYYKYCLSSLSLPAAPSRSRSHSWSCLRAAVSGIESTPNPSSFIVRISEPLSGMESLEGTLRGKTFTTPTTSTPTEVAVILRIEGIESVYAMATALTINKRASAKWEHILPLVLTALVGSSSEEQQSLLLQDVSALLENNNKNKEELQTRVGGQVRMRLQVSYRIPIQIEATGFLGTTKRAKATSPKFSQSMDDLLLKEDVNGGRIDFFAGRTWVDRGVRYLDETTDDDSIVSEQDQERSEMDRVLEAELQELNAAYSADRLAAIVAESLLVVGDKLQQQQPSSSSASGVMVVDVDVEDLDLQKVDHYCDLAEQGDMEALSVLAKFVSSHTGLMAARRNALAYLGGTGDIAAAAATREQGSAYDYAALVLDNAANGG
jgi:hypothetical protein